VIDPAHPQAELYQFSTRLLYWEHTIPDGINAMWNLLDNSDAMLRVYRWLADHPSGQRGHDHCQNWVRHDYVALMRAYLADVDQDQVHFALKHTMRNSELFRECIDFATPDTAQQLFRDAIEEPVNREAAVFLAETHPKDL